MAEADGSGQLLRLVLPAGELRVRHLELPVRQPAALAPHHRAGRGGGRIQGQHQPLPRDRGGLGRRRAQPLRLSDLRHRTRPAATRPAGHTALPGGLQLRLQHRPRRLRQGRGGRGQHLGGLVARRRTRTAGSRRGRPTSGPTPRWWPGAIDGLHFEGLNSVGIYASPGSWNGIVGNYSPAVPYWAADWEINPATTCGNVHSIYAGLPEGPGRDRPVQLAQRHLSGRRDGHGLRQRLRLLNRAGARRVRAAARSVDGVVVAEEAPAAVVDLPGGHRGVLGAQLEAGPGRGPRPPELGQQ